MDRFVIRTKRPFNDVTQNEANTKETAEKVNSPKKTLKTSPVKQAVTSPLKKFLMKAPESPKSKPQPSFSTPPRKKAQEREGPKPQNRVLSPLAKNPSPSKLSFVPLKPHEITEDEREVEAMRAVHYPLPPALKDREIFRARRRFVPIRLEPAEKKKEDEASGKRKPGKQSEKTIDRWGSNEKPFTVIHDRKRPMCSKEMKSGEEEEEHVHERREQRIQSLEENENARLIMETLADLQSNCVVVLGRDRLSELDRRQKLKEYEEYESRKKAKEAESPTKTTVFEKCGVEGKNEMKSPAKSIVLINKLQEEEIIEATSPAKAKDEEEDRPEQVSASKVTVDSSEDDEIKFKDAESSKKNVLKVKLKGKRGRPRKETNSREQSETEEEGTEAPKNVLKIKLKGKRGRPKKERIDSPAKSEPRESETEEDSRTAEVPKKIKAKRGRPRKDANSPARSEPVESEAEETSSKVLKIKVGRKRKLSNSDDKDDRVESPMKKKTKQMEPSQRSSPKKANSNEKLKNFVKSPLMQQWLQRGAK